MLDNSNEVSRRSVLRVIGTTGVAAGLTGTAAGEELVDVNVGYDAESGRTAILNAAVDVRYEFGFDAVTATMPATAARTLAERPDVRYVEADAEVHALAQTLPWGIDRVDAEVAHANGETGAGADIAIIDTGIDSTHPDLQANLGSGRAFIGGISHSDWQDDNGHGTHCAGIADGVDNSQGVVGVSTQATLHAVKVLSASGSGLTSDVAAGIEYTADQGWDVGSLSLGGGESDMLRDAVNYAWNEDVLLVAAAGNSGPCTDCVGYPAAYQNCMAISATNANDGLASFSSTGPEVDLAAPGDSIYSTYVGGTYTTLSGTSMACPHVSGAGGQLVANGYSNDEARRQLTSTAEDLGLPANEQGSGLLDAATALGYDSSDDL